MRKRFPLFVLFLTTFIDLLGFGLVIPILPNLVTDSFKQPEWMAGVIAAVFSFSQFLFSPFWGTLSDRIGRRPVILISVLITAASYLFFSFATINLFFAVFVIYRFLAGVGAANLSATNAYIADSTTPEKRTKSLAMIGVAFGLGFIFGPPVGGYVKQHFGVESVGYLAFGLSLINFISAWFFLPESIKEKQRDAPFTFKPVSGIIAALKRPVIRELFMLNFLFIMSFSMMQVTAALLWNDFYFLTDEKIGYVFAFIGVSAAVVQGGLVGPLNKKYGEKTLITAGFILMAAGLAAMPFVPVNLFVPLELLALLCIALANGCLTPSLISLLTQHTPSAEQGKMLGLNQGFGSIGRIIGPIFGASLYQSYHALPYVSAAVFLLVALGVSMRLFRPMVN